MSLGGETAIGRHLLRHVLQAQRFRDDVRPFHESSDVARAVASDPDALGLFNLSHRSGKVRALGIVDDTGRVRWPIRSEVAGGRYPLDRFLLVYARRDSSGHLGAFAVSFLQFMLSDEGQDIIARGHKGYIPLDREERAIERTKLVR
jgi:phosphate transport system substrate-binding protein